jgi:hypothetical protein
VRALLALLESIADDRERLADLSLEDRRRLMIAAGRIARPDRDEARSVARALRKKEHVQKKSAIEAQLDSTGIRQLRAMPVFVTPEPSAPLLGAGEERDEEPDRLIEPRCCYVCKKRFETLHHFYDSMCQRCGDFNFTKRTQTADLRGRVAVVTGARVKIGYQASILLLRAGCRVLSRRRAFRTTPRCATRARRTSPQWGDRLQVHGLDLRHTPSVERSAHLGCNHDAATRLRDQQRLPDGAPARGLLPPPDGRERRQPLAALPAAAQAAAFARSAAARVHLAGGARRCRRADPACGLTTPRSCRSTRCSPRTCCAGRERSSPTAASTRTCSRSTCASTTAGACRWPRCPRSSCSRCSSSTPIAPFVLNAR